MNLLLKEYYFETEHNSFGEISITDPEQFVPLFILNLTNRGQVSRKVNNTWYPEDVYKQLINCIKTKNKPLFVVTLKSYLKSLLLDKPSSYQLLLPRANVRLYNREVFLGKYFNDTYAFYRSSNLVYLLGTALQLIYIQTDYFKSKKYNFIESRSTTKLDPLALIVVKAKHIPKLKLAMYLQLKNKVSIPYGDIKLLKTVHLSDFNTLHKNVELSSDWLPVEYCTTEKLVSYLVKPKDFTLTAEQILNKVKSLKPNVEVVV